MAPVCNEIRAKRQRTPAFDRAREEGMLSASPTPKIARDAGVGNDVAGGRI